MDVLLTTDGRVFDGEATTFEPGDVAWFEEDVLLVTEIKDGVAQAIVHPAAVEMMKVALEHEPGREAVLAAYKIHHRTMAKGYLAALAFATSASKGSPIGGERVQLGAGEAEYIALCAIREEAEKAQELVR